MNAGATTWADGEYVAVQGHAASSVLRLRPQDLAILRDPAGPRDDQSWRRVTAAMPQVSFDQLVRERVLVEYQHPYPVSSYHQATKDYPFLDMGQGMDSLAVDARTMANYIREADVLPSPYLDLEGDVVREVPRSQDISLDGLSNRPDLALDLVLAAAFGVRAVQQEYFDPATDYFQMRLLRKSVPSGGSRHPAECFLDVRRSPVLAPGTYHFSTRRSALVRTAIDMSGLDRPATTDPQTDATWDIDLHVAMAVERDMFRYRDPRSFRAVLVDAGHVDAQLAAVAAYVNWQYTSTVALLPTFGCVVDSSLDDDNLPRVLLGTLRSWS